MSYLNYPKFIDLSQVPEKTEFERTDMLFIQNINEENAAIEKKNIVFPTNQLVFEKQLQDTQPILQNTKQIVDNIYSVLNQKEVGDIQNLFSGDYANQINQVLSSITNAMAAIDEKLNEADLEYSGQLSASKTHPDEYFDSQWVDLKAQCTEFKHNLGTIPLHVTVKYRLKEDYLGWQAGTVFYNNLPSMTSIYYDSLNYGGSAVWPLCVEGNINQLGDKIFLSLPNNDIVSSAVSDKSTLYTPFTHYSRLNNFMQEEDYISSGRKDVQIQQVTTFYRKFQVRVLQYKRNG